MENVAADPLGRRVGRAQLRVLVLERLAARASARRTRRRRGSAGPARSSGIARRRWSASAPRPAPAQPASPGAARRRRARPAGPPRSRSHRNRIRRHRQFPPTPPPSPAGRPRTSRLPQPHPRTGGGPQPGPAGGRSVLDRRTPTGPPNQSSTLGGRLGAPSARGLRGISPRGRRRALSRCRGRGAARSGRTAGTRGPGRRSGSARRPPAGARGEPEPAPELPYGPDGLAEVAEVGVRAPVHAEPEPGPGLDRGAERVEVGRPQQPGVEGHRAGPGVPEQRRPAGSARSSAPRSAPRRSPPPAPGPARPGPPAPRPTAACRTRWRSGPGRCAPRQRRLVDLQHDLGARQPARPRRRRAARTPSASDWVRSRTAPGSETRLVPVVQLDRRRQRPRPGDLQLQRPGVVLGERPRARRGRGPASPVARRWSRPGWSTSRQPDGCRSTGRSTRKAVPRPTMSAPAPRPGSSGRCGRSGSSPNTIRMASAGSVPGIDPTPSPRRSAPGPVTRRTLAPAARAGLSVGGAGCRAWTRTRSGRRRRISSATSPAPGRGRPAAVGRCCPTAAST